MSWRSMLLMGPTFFIAACISEPRQQIYELEDASEYPMSTGAGPAGPALQLQSVLIPDYLDTTDIRWRVGRHELQSSSTGRWVDRLSLAITHALLSDLAIRLPTHVLMLARPAEKSARQILVNVETFDVWPDGHCVLAANWTIFERDNRTVLASGRNTIVTATVSGSNPGDKEIVTGMADAVGKLADSIAAAAKGLAV
jgi:uncharacterized lipoprotein YmbA